MLIILCCALIPIVAIDVPFQSWNHNRQLKMTKQEIKDEFKDSEGKPEVKGRIRQLQMQMAMRRMMGDVPKADVIITNPTHYSVALKYDAGKPGAAPKVLAKGVDEVAMKIREIGREYDIPVMSSPPLTRALYHATEIGQEIPEGSSPPSPRCWPMSISSRSSAVAAAGARPPSPRICPFPRVSQITQWWQPDPGFSPLCRKQGRYLLVETRRVASPHGLGWPWPAW
jgi:type III secretion system FlhB-like substrate exporter